ncbi:TPA: hypothetical protein RPW09_001955, partial [Campylobacter fetus subsp. venerealis]|nr:hypothetical protein [Campylobacter fetus subsp. venerealis]HDX6244838.1 hypothetical protein [Campylobacter fetus subsp. venerealis]HDX6268399.1 hypothetical protein [Campylobacter fetus subsp. venerealis]HDX6272346.1 hypothetical protein [Campylobacter fetus subsp. venerealis]HDX6276270.1 hypothetical protein [Campylobacter fetus subsp. venerealis]
MGYISSINFEKSIAINTEHNDRTLAPSYLIDTEKGAECNRTAESARALKNQIIAKAKENYTQNTGQKFQAKSYEWSAVCNIKPETTMQDLEKLAEHFKKKYGFQCYQIAIHRDEGHKNENGEIVPNLHAHLEFITLDRETGKQNFKMRDFTKQVMREIQSETAEILQMQRGQDKRLSGAKRIKPREYARQKEAEKKTIKEATQDLKKQIKKKEQELEAERLTSKEALQELEAIRKEMKRQGFTKEQFAHINELKKGIKEKTAEPMTRQDIEQLKEQVKNQSGIFSKKNNVIDALTKKLTEAENDKAVLNQIVIFTEQNEAKIIETIRQELENENKAVLERLKYEQETQLKTENEKFKSNLRYELVQETNKLAVSRTSYESKTNDLATAEAKAKEAEISYTRKRQELTQSSIIQELTNSYEARLKAEQEKQAKLEEQNENLKLDNERLRMLNEFAMEMKEKAEQELKEIKKRLQNITEAVERAVKGSWQIVYDRSAYGFKSAHIKLKEFFNKEPQEQERIINSNIQAHKDIEQEKQEKNIEREKKSRSFK